MHPSPDSLHAKVTASLLAAIEQNPGKPVLPSSSAPAITQASTPGGPMLENSLTVPGRLVHQNFS